MTSDAIVRHLARQLAEMQRRIRDMETASQAGMRSVEGGSLDFYDDDDNLIGTIGVQRDGSIAWDVKSGAKPQAPTEPDVNPIPGGAIVAWDGRFEEAQPHKAIDRIAVHMDETAGFTPDRDTEVAAIYSHVGGTAVIPIDDGTDWYVKLVAVSKGQVWSDPSTEVHVAAVDSEVAFYQDEFVLTVGGAQNLTLTFQPLPFSEHLYWNGLYQREDENWTREGTTLTLTDTPVAPAVGDVVVLEYAYEELAQEVIVGWQSPGWSYLDVTASDSTDRSGTAFDDSAWAVAAAPFGDAIGHAFDYLAGLSWPAPATTFTPVTALWLRRDLPSVPKTDLLVSVRCDNKAQVYWNGTLIGTTTAAEVGEYTFTVPASSVTDTNVLAVRGEDTGPSGSGNHSYLDVQVVSQ